MDRIAMVRNPPEKELDIQAAAYLAGEGLSQRAIAITLGISQAGISRLHKEAKKRGWLEKRVRFVKRISPKQKELIELRIFPQQLKKRFDMLAGGSGSSTLRAVTIFHSGNVGTTRKAWNKRLEQFGRACAAHILVLLGRSSVTGVSWGHTIANVVRGLRELRLDLPPRWPQPVRFVPILGEPLNSSPQ